MNQRTDHPPTASAAPVARIDLLLFYVLLALLAARPMIGETFEFSGPAFVEAVVPSAGATPVTTTALDSLSLIAASLALVRRGRWRRNLAIVIGLGGLIGSVLLSSAVARDGFRAVYEGWNLIAVALAAAALGTLVQRRWMWQIVLAALLAAGAVSAAKCLMQVFMEFPDTLDMWLTEIKPQLAQRGVDVDAPAIINYERRLQSGEATGYLTLSNLTASVLTMWLLVSLGLLVGWLRAGRPNETRQADTASRTVASLVGIGLVALLTTALWYTGSLGGYGACAVGLLLFALIGAKSGFVAPRAGRLLVVGAALYVLTIVGVAAYGVRSGTLPHPSLAFRWHYWTTAVEAWQTAPLTGLGRGNFSAAYLQFKPPESTEEVRDPHNIWLTLLTELGPLGLAAGALLCGAVVQRSLRHAAPSAGQDPVSGLLPLIPRAAYAAFGVLAVQALGSGTPFSHPVMPIIWAVDVAVVWCGAFVAALLLVQLPSRSETAWRWCFAGVTAALVAALIHGLVDFTLLTAGGASAFALLSIVAMRAQPTVEAPLVARAPLSRRMAAVVVALLLVGWHPLYVTYNVGRVVAQLAATRVLVHGRALAERPDLVLRHAERLCAQPRVPAVLTAALQAGRQVIAAHPSRTEALLPALERLHADAQATIRTPANDTAGNWSALGAFEAALAPPYRAADRDAESLAMLRSAAASYERSATLYPNDPRRHLSAGLAWLEVHRETYEEDASKHARAHFDRALAIDATRPPAEVTRLSPDERRTIERGLRELEPVESTPSE